MIHSAYLQETTTEGTILPPRIVMEDEGRIVRGKQLSATTSLVYEPALEEGSSIVTIKYSHDINIVVQNMVPYRASMTYKIYSPPIRTEDGVQDFIGRQVLEIHEKHPTAKIISIDISTKKTSNQC